MSASSLPLNFRSGLSMRIENNALAGSVNLSQSAEARSTSDSDQGVVLCVTWAIYRYLDHEGLSVGLRMFVDGLKCRP